MKPKALVVDDDHLHQLLLAEIVRDLGFDVDVASNGREALEQLETGPLPAVILLDLDMPVMNGWELVAHVASDSRLATVPIVIVSGSSKAIPLSGPVVGRLAKPFAVPELSETVARVTKSGVHLRADRIDSESASRTSCDAARPEDAVAECAGSEAPDEGGGGTS